MTLPIEIVIAIVTSIGSGIASFIAVKVNLQWVIKSLNDHEKKHEKHEAEINYLKERIFKYASR